MERMAIGKNAVEIRGGMLSLCQAIPLFPGQ
jgi:hypothetical protein